MHGEDSSCVQSREPSISAVGAPSCPAQRAKSSYPVSCSLWAIRDQLVLAHTTTASTELPEQQWEEHRAMAQGSLIVQLQLQSLTH